MRKRSGRGSSAGARMRPRIGITGQDAVQLKKDIDPELYGQHLQQGLGVDVDRLRDALEIPLARRALERDLPVLGICRGIQVLNVAAGGTLLQDIVLAGAGRASQNQREK